MSYLTHFEQIRTNAYRVQWRSARGTIYTILDRSAVHYRRFSKLGELLYHNRESERHFIAEAIEKTTGTRPKEWRAY